MQTNPTAVTTIRPSPTVGDSVPPFTELPYGSSTPIIPIAVTKTPPPPCQLNPCGERALCVPDGIYHECICPDGTYGNPYTLCRPECVIDSGCPRNKACKRERCYDPCTDVCGANAECSVIMHRPMCTCPSTLAGDPYTACNPLPPTSELLQSMFYIFDIIYACL